MKKIIIIVSAFVFAFSLSACKSCGSKTIKSSVSQEASVELAGTHWKLVELNGESVEGKTAKEPQIILDSENHRISGNAGCNLISGSYQITEPGKITFSQMIATRMMCFAGMEVENAFLQALNNVDGYTITGETLTLTVANAPVASFVAGTGEAEASIDD